MHLSPWTLPAPLPGSWSFKPLSSARTGMTRLRNGELELTIKHDVIHGVTREMLAWRRHIVEALGANTRYLINIVARVAHLDETGILLATEQAGISIGRLHTPLLPLAPDMGTLEHTFHVAPRGTRYESRMVVGHDSLFGRLFLNRTVLPALVLPDDMGRAWLRHNVEEVGHLENFLPILYGRWLAGHAAVPQMDDLDWIFRSTMTGGNV